MTYESLAVLESRYQVGPGSVLCKCYIGQETGTKSSSKGFVFVADGDGSANGETPLGKSRLCQRLQQEQTIIDQQEGDGWVSGGWSEITFLVPVGTILKLFVMGTFNGTSGKRFGGVYVRADASFPEIRCIGRAVTGRSRAWLQGRLEVIPVARFKELGILCEPRYAYSYDPSNGAEIVTISPGRSAVSGNVVSGRRMRI